MTTATGARQTVLHTARKIVASLDQSSGESGQLIIARLRDSVIRPLDHGSASAECDAPRPGAEAGPNDVDEALWDLARAATALLAEHPDEPELAEATAALQDLALGSAGEPAADARLAELQALQSGR